MSDHLVDDPWVMQLVVRVEKVTPPTRSDACAAAARAVVTLLASAAAAPEGAWHADVTDWASGPFRKHCRRARGAAWDRVQDLPGVSVTHATATVTALPPTRQSGIPAAVAKLQLSGSELPDPHPQDVADPRAGAVVIAISPDPVLPVGKAAAAAGHAAQLTWQRMPPPRRQAWLEAGLPVVIAHPDRGTWRAGIARAPVVIADAGLTVVTPGTVTATATWT